MTTRPSPGSRRRCGHTVYIDYYSEDRTPKGDKIVAKVNELLKQAQAEMVGGPVFGCPARHDKRVARD